MEDNRMGPTDQEEWQEVEMGDLTMVVERDNPEAWISAVNPVPVKR